MTHEAVHVMVVEDEADALDAVAEVLWQAGYRVSTADDGCEALALLGGYERNDLPDVILTDLLMPLLDGWELTRRVAEDPRLCTIPVVVMTASGRNAVANAPTAVGYVPKPVVIDQLLLALERAIGATRRPRWQSGARPLAPVVDSLGGARRSSRPPAPKTARLRRR